MVTRWLGMLSFPEQQPITRTVSIVGLRLDEATRVTDLRGGLFYETYSPGTTSLAPSRQPLLGGTPSEVPDRWEAAAPSLDPSRVTLVHGAVDDDVPIFAVDNAVEAGVPLIEAADADHYSVLTTGAAGFTEVIDTLESVARE